MKSAPCVQPMLRHLSMNGFPKASAPGCLSPAAVFNNSVAPVTPDALLGDVLLMDGRAVRGQEHVRSLHVAMATLALLYRR